MVTYVAIPFQIYTLTGSNFAVGAIGLVELVPLVVFGLYGGALADHVDRRRLLICDRRRPGRVHRRAGRQRVPRRPAGVADLRGLGVLLAPRPSLQRPVPRGADAAHRRATTQLAAANALTSLGMQVGVLVGPAIGGLLVAYVGIGWCFLVDIAGLVVATLLFVAMRPTRTATRPRRRAWPASARAVRYALRRRDLLGTYLVDIAAMLLAMPVVLFPALAEEVFDRPELLGLLYSAETVGALLATALSGWTGAGAPPRPGDRGRRGGVRRLHRGSPA